MATKPRFRAGSSALGDGMRLFNGSLTGIDNTGLGAQVMEGLTCGSSNG
jgi:hypothetical protein